MFTIGEFARHGRVSVRMLRHYDSIGLLPPAEVDPHSGYRYYAAAQLAKLNRIIALRELGFGLDQISAMLDERIGVEQLRGMLRLRQAELHDSLAVSEAQLRRVQARLHSIESETSMPTHDVVVKKLERITVAELTDQAASFTPEHIAPVITPLCSQLGQRLQASSLIPTGPLVAYYETAADSEDQVIIHAAIPITGDQNQLAGLTVIELAGANQAATVVHRGSMDDVLVTIDGLARWIDANGYRAAGYPRELYLECPEDISQWVTELQQPIEPVSGSDGRSG